MSVGGTGVVGAAVGSSGITVGTGYGTADGAVVVGAVGTAMRSDVGMGDGEVRLVGEAIGVSEGVCDGA